MGLILDLAVAALALVVIGSLALLAWTLGVSATRATREGHRRVTEYRRAVAGADDRIRSSAARASGAMARRGARARSFDTGRATDA